VLCFRGWPFCPVISNISTSIAIMAFASDLLHIIRTTVSLGPHLSYHQIAIKGVAQCQPTGLCKYDQSDISRIV